MNEKKPNILCIGVLDTKGDEIKFLAQECRRFGANAQIMELSLGGEVGWADVSLSEVLAEDNIKKEDVFKASRTEAIEIVGKAGAKKITKLYQEGKVDGVISWAGSVGTTVSTMAMRALPIGVPKFMLSTTAASDVSSWLGSKDIYITNPISEKGVNKVTRKIVANAVSGLVAMAKVGELPETEVKPLAAATAYGTTTPAVTRCLKYMEKRGFDTITIHQVGTGATMEDLIRSKMISAVYDLTIGELSNNYFGSIYGIDKDWEGERLTAASDMGIPQIVCPGGLGQCAYGPVDSMPQKIMDEFKDGTRVSYQNSGKPYIHNSAVTINLTNSGRDRNICQ
ncbi:MAG: Tm-1-like ATP-binding domain-containing protein [Actinomycetota bacterium]|nr:Tm-1-like ATP-binding domain-containing protein [Actinomycetota bacterium]